MVPVKGRWGLHSSLRQVKNLITELMDLNFCASIGKSKMVISANLNAALNYFIHIFCNFLQINNSCCSPVSFSGDGDGVES